MLHVWAPLSSAAKLPSTKQAIRGLTQSVSSLLMRVHAEGSVDVVRQWLSLLESNSKNKWVDDILVSVLEGFVADRM